MKTYTVEIIRVVEYTEQVTVQANSKEEAQENALSGIVLETRSSDYDNYDEYTKLNQEPENPIQETEPLPIERNIYYMPTPERAWSGYATRGDVAVVTIGNHETREEAELVLELAIDAVQ